MSRFDWDYMRHQEQRLRQFYEEEYIRKQACYSSEATKQEENQAKKEAKPEVNPLLLLLEV